MSDDNHDLKTRILEAVNPAKERLVSGATRIDEFVESNERKTMYAVLAIISLFTVGSRLLPLRGEDFSLSPESPLFSELAGYEAYRGVMYSAKNFPQILLSDTLTNYPIEGTEMTGGLLDILLSAVAMIISVAMPLSQAVTLTLYLVGPVFAVLAVLLVYKLGEEVFDRTTGILAAALLALFPGQSLQSAVAGAGSKLPMYVVLFGALTLSLIYYTRAAQNKVFTLRFLKEDLTTWDLFTKSLLSVLVLSLFFLLSDPIYVMVYSGFIGLIAAQYAILNSYKDDTPESVTSALFLPLVFGTVVVSLVALLSSSYTVAHVGIIFGVATVVGVLSIMDSISEALEQPSPQIAIATTILGAVGVGAIGYVYGDPNYIRAVVLPSQSASYYQSIDSLISYDIPISIIRNFGLFGFISVIGYAIYHANSLYNSLIERFELGGVILSTSAIVTAALGVISVDWFAFTAMAVALFGSYFVFFIARKAELFHLNSVDIRAYHILALITVIALFVPVLLAPVNTTAVAQAQNQDITEAEWASASEQLQEIGDQPVDPYSSPMQQPDSGVVTWASQGSESIQAIGGYPSTGPERPSPQFSSEYLLAQSESDAFNAEEKYNADADYIVLDWRSTNMRSQMGSMVETHPEFSVRQFYTPVYDAQTRRLAFGINKEPYYNSLATRLYYYHGSSVQPQPVTVTHTTSELGGRSVATTFLPVQMDTQQHIQKFDSMQRAQQYVNGELPQEDSSQESDGPTLQPGQEGTDSSDGESSEDSQSFEGTRQIGGIGTNSPTSVPALRHHRYVASSSQSIIDDRAFNRYAQTTGQYTPELRYSDLIREDGHVKVFQKVEGVKVEGSGGPSENTIQIAIALENEQTGTPVRYIQTVETDENGNFETTLPYASEGVPEDYTVKPTQNYQMLGQVNEISQEDGQLAIRTTYWYSGEVTVSNEQVTGGETIQVQLEEMNSEELTEDIQGDGIIQPRQRGSQSTDDGSEGDSSGENGN